MAGPIKEPEEVARSVVDAIRDERFLVLSDPIAQTWMQRKTDDPERWLRGHAQGAAATGGGVAAEGHMSEDVFILDAVRTPIGRHGGALAGVRPDDLAAGVIAGLVERSPSLDPSAIGDVVFGDGNAAGEDNRNVARMALLLAGVPPSVPGTTVNRLCGSGLEAVIAASRAIAVGDHSICIAGGVESMSRAPWVLLKPDRGYARTNETLWSTTLGWRMVNPRMPADWTISLGEGAELLAAKYSISREEQDAFALRSHRQAAAAWDAGRYAGEVVPVDGIDLDRDECIRPDASLEALARLRPAFRPDGTVTAGNASPLNDGAAAVLLGDAEGARRAGRRAARSHRRRAESVRWSRPSTASGRSPPPTRRLRARASDGRTSRLSS